MSVPETNYQDWTAKAEDDLLNIENNLAAQRVPWSTVCFHAQQAAEKNLKAFLVYHGQTPARIHDLIPLLTECRRRDESHCCLKTTAADSAVTPPLCAIPEIWATWLV